MSRKTTDGSQTRPYMVWYFLFDDMNDLCVSGEKLKYFSLTYLNTVPDRNEQKTARTRPHYPNCPVIDG
jgi:hypothetical protein